MSELLLATLGTSADIDQLITHKVWDPMVLTKQGLDIGRIEVIDVSTCRATNGFEVQRWIEVDSELHLYRPLVGEIDCYIDPIAFKETLAQDLAERVHGDRLRSAMHLTVEPHVHSFDYWCELDQDQRAYEEAISNCAQMSRDLRDLGHFRQAISKVQDFTRISCAV